MDNEVEESPKTKQENCLPLARVKTIMKSTPNVEFVGDIANMLLTRATEIFVRYLALNAFKKSNKELLEYNNLAQFVKEEEKLDFLTQIIPKQLTVRQVRELQAKDDSSSSESEDSEEEDSSSSDSSDDKGSTIEISDAE